MDKDMRRRIKSYLLMADEFIRAHESGPEFRRRFIDSFKKDQSLYEAPVSDVLMRFFGEAECYEPDPRLLEELKRGDPAIYLNEAELREKARAFIREISSLLARG